MQTFKYNTVLTESQKTKQNKNKKTHSNHEYPSLPHQLCILSPDYSNAVRKNVGLYRTVH